MLVNNNKYCNKRYNIIETKILKNFEYYFVLFAKKIENFVKHVENRWFPRFSLYYMWLARSRDAVTLLFCI